MDVDTLLNGVKVFINGAWNGNAKEPVKLYLSLKDKKYKGIINIYTSIIFDTKRKEIRVINDAGRLTRPVLRVINNKMVLDESYITRLKNKEIKWNDLLVDIFDNNTVLDYIDAAEQNYSMIAMKPGELTKS